MARLLEKLKSISKVQWLAVALIVIGLGIMIPKAMGMMAFSREMRFATEHDFAAGNLSPELLRPWMTLRYISAAYAVPQAYLFEVTHIQPKQETSLIALERLNRQMGLGEVDDTPVLMQTISATIVAYRAHPVVTGLIEQQVEDWMTMQYIANSTGLPVESLFNQLGLPAEGNAYKPLGFLGDELKYAGGSRTLIAVLQKIVDEQAPPAVRP